VPFTLDVLESAGQKTIKNTENAKINTAQKKQTTQNTATQHYSSLVACYDTRPGNDVGVL